MPRAKQPPAPRKPAAPPAPPVEANGITIDFAALTVSRGDRSVHVSPRQAQLIGVLARVMPNLMRRADLAARAWPDLSPDSGNTTISTNHVVLAERLLSIGLVLHQGSV